MSSTALRRNAPIHAIFVKTGRKVPHLCSSRPSFLIHFYLAVVSSIGERMNNWTRSPIRTRVDTTVVNV